LGVSQVFFESVTLSVLEVMVLLGVISGHWDCRRQEETAMPETRGLLGRGRELGAVAAFLDGLPSGLSGLVLEGEAGIGKTSVWLAGVADAGARSYLVLSSRPTEAEATLSFAGLGGSRVRFTYPLFASAIYSGAPPWRRREAHRKLSLIAATEEERARHQALAAEGPHEEAAVALTRAAHAAAARGAPDAAAELAELAVARTPGGLAPARRSRRLAAEYLYRAGDAARARAGLTAVVEDMPGSPERAAARLVLARILLHDAGELVALPVLEGALTEASPDRILQARIHISLRPRPVRHQFLPAEYARPCAGCDQRRHL
jgi:hypothetical protein